MSCFGMLFGAAIVDVTGLSSSCTGISMSVLETAMVQVCREARLGG